MRSGRSARLEIFSTIDTSQNGLLSREEVRYRPLRPVAASLIVRCKVRAAFSQHFTTEDELTNYVDYLCGLGTPAASGTDCLTVESAGATKDSVSFDEFEKWALFKRVSSVPPSQSSAAGGD